MKQLHNQPFCTFQMIHSLSHLCLKTCQSRRFQTLIMRPSILKSCILAKAAEGLAFFFSDFVAQQTSHDISAIAAAAVADIVGDTKLDISRFFQVPAISAKILFLFRSNVVKCSNDGSKWVLLQAKQYARFQDILVLVNVTFLGFRYPNQTRH